MKIVTVEEMLTIEQEADSSGHSYDVMMEHAGSNLAEVVDDTFGYLKEDGVLGLVGKGNNGGDTLVALAVLAKSGWKITAYLIHDRESEDPLVRRVQEAGGEIAFFEKDQDFQKLEELLIPPAVLLDGILGTGIKLPLREPVPKVLSYVRDHIANAEDPPYVVAVDCPSGVDCATGGAAKETLSADLTITMAAVKTGLFEFPANNYVGELEVVGIGLPPDLAPWKAITRSVFDESWASEMLPPRPRNAHKGTFGTALIVAGSSNYTGAALLAGKAAYRVGAGLVTLAIPSLLHTTLAGQFPEATWLLLPNELGVINVDAADLLHSNLGRATAILLGPGFGMEDTTRNFIAHLLTPKTHATSSGIGFVKNPKKGQEKPSDGHLPPMVVDADGLKLLAQIPNWSEKLPPSTVLTPHPGEMANITGMGKEEIMSDRLGIAERYAREWELIVVLKGAFTIVAAPDGRTAMIPVASPALARAGTGDVLAGIITGLRAQGVKAFEAASLGAWIHARAGLYAESQLGSSAAVLAGDVLDSIIDVLTDIED